MTEKEVIAAQMAERPKLYYRLSFSDCGPLVIPPEALSRTIEEFEDQPVKTEKIYLTDAEYEALPEFES